MDIGLISGVTSVILWLLLTLPSLRFARAEEAARPEARVPVEPSGEEESEEEIEDLLDSPDVGVAARAQLAAIRRRL